MKTEEDMNIKIQQASTDGLTDNKGECNALTGYINHEDQERIDEGKEPFPYTREPRKSYGSPRIRLCRNL